MPSHSNAQQDLDNRTVTSLYTAKEEEDRTQTGQAEAPGCTYVCTYKIQLYIYNVFTYSMYPE